MESVDCTHSSLGVWGVRLCIFARCLLPVACCLLPVIVKKSRSRSLCVLRASSRWYLCPNLTCDTYIHPSSEYHLSQPGHEAMNERASSISIFLRLTKLRAS